MKKNWDQLFESLDGKSKRNIIPFSAYLDEAVANPEKVFRDIFQLFQQMVHHYVPEGVNEYPDDPESIGYINYDLRRLFVEGVDSPFFADRLLANRFMNHVDALTKQRKKIYLFDGPPGSGKSTFLNNLLAKLEEYTATPEGTVYETVWRLDTKKIGLDASLLTRDPDPKRPDAPRLILPDEYLVVPCPSHDNPILQIPKHHRRAFLEDILEDGEFKEKVFHDKQYEWIFSANPCTICTSIYQALIDNEKVGSAAEAFNMLNARRYKFSRVLGEGISVLNPGDERNMKPQTNEMIQAYLNALFREGSTILYLFSEYARTNNGIYVISDVKGQNTDRLKDLHGIISDSVHKVGPIEEHTSSFFMGLINPDDKKAALQDSAMIDRIIDISVPYVLDYRTETEIYRHIFGDEISYSFLPRILENFAKVVVSSRLEQKSAAMDEWIKEPQRYGRFCDDSLLLLKMDIYVGQIPEWLSDEDKKTFTAEKRRKVIGEAEHEGNAGFSGRESISLFNDFMSRFARPDKLITFDNLLHFYQQRNGNLSTRLPAKFLEALERSYNYSVVQEVRASMLVSNDEMITRDVLNYIWATNISQTKTKCPFTDDVFEVNDDYFNEMSGRILGSKSKVDPVKLRNETQRSYLTAMAQEVDKDHPITDTEFFKGLRDRYVRSLKENVLEPFVKSENFRRAIMDYDTPSFTSYDPRIQQDVLVLVGNLQSKFNYTEKGAKEICVYIIDKKLVEATK